MRPAIDRNVARVGVAAGAGVLFGVGLGVAGMTRPDKVAAFLDVTGAWDPSLALVLVTAVAVHAVAWRTVDAEGAPWLGDRFHLPRARDIDARLVVGSAIFGVGWGLSGTCPGPGLVTATTGVTEAVAFVVTMLVGMGAHEAWEVWKCRRG